MNIGASLDYERVAWLEHLLNGIIDEYLHLIAVFHHGDDVGVLVGVHVGESLQVAKIVDIAHADVHVVQAFWRA